MIGFGAKLSRVGKGWFMMREQRGTAQGAIDFFSRFSSSEQFERVFKEGMGLVEETANYLDGQGRADSRALDRPGAIAYATESMRLTTRLMQLASWLLLQRAIAAGEVTRDDATREKAKVSLNDIGQGHAIPGGEDLPEGLIELVQRSLRLHERILVLDRMIAADAVAVTGNENPVASQINQLARALSAG
jgi:regulator of CtrA degradation